jgi:SAM-dependent methyltransferase
VSTEPALSAVVRSLASHRAQFESFTMSATDLVVREVPDAREVLDLASGTGDPALALAAALPRARVLATDCVSELLMEASREARVRGLTNLQTVQMDMRALPLSAARTDAVTSRLGIQFAQDIRGALAEIRRVLKPGGVTCHVVWGARDQPLLREILRDDGPRFEPGQPGPFQFSQAGSLAQALADAGFIDVEERTSRNDWVWQGDARSFWQFMQETSAGSLAPSETPDAAIARLKSFERNETLIVPVEVHFARARRPAA